MMPNLSITYPSMPEGANRAILEPSKAFKKQVYRSIAAIALFLLTYILLFVGSIALAVAFCMLGYVVLMAHIGFFGLVVGAGFAVCGVMLVFFVTKFLFKRTKNNYFNKIEVTEQEQPELFAFIYRLTDETGAPKPKRIFITADVNAAVFYNPAFWTMFLPVKKNLQIGLGLVNSVNVSEFKAVMAHEFGHFSQRSMKVGSYVYNFNRVVYNMLFENQGYDKALAGWARLHNIFRLMAVLNVKIIEGMQAILRQVYLVVNKTYLKLSREMEFHADAMAAYASGSNNAISLLRRIDVGQVCYSNMLDYWNLKLKDGERADNVYTQHAEVIKLYAEKFKLGLDESGLPIMDKKVITNTQSELIIDDQWASHPSDDDREQQLLKINLNAAVLTEPASVLFRNLEELQLQLTDILYATVTLKEPRMINLAAFKEEFQKTINSHRFNKIYKDYFDFRNIVVDTESLIHETVAMEAVTFDGLLSEENAELPRVVERMQRDIDALDNISINKEIRTFDYKGVKYSRADTAAVQQLIEEERKATLERIAKLDSDIFKYFYNISPDKEILLDKYQKLMAYQESSIADYDLHNNIIRAMQPVYGRMVPTQIAQVLQQVYKQEQKVKPRLEELVGNEDFNKYLSADQLKAIDTYLKNKWIYYYEPTYDNTAIGVFNNAMEAYHAGIYNKNFEMKADLLDYQASLLKAE